MPGSPIDAGTETWRRHAVALVGALVLLELLWEVLPLHSLRSRGEA